MKKRSAILFAMTLFLIGGVISPSFVFAKSFSSEVFDASRPVIDNFVPLSEGDPSQPQGPNQGDTNPFRSDLSGQVSQKLPSQFVKSQGNSPVPLVLSLIRYLLTFLGMGSIILITYAGYRWMTAAGNDEQVAEAKKTLRNALIGLILIFASWSLVFWVTRRIQVSTGSFGSGGTFSISTDGIEVGPVGRFTDDQSQINSGP